MSILAQRTIFSPDFVAFLKRHYSDHQGFLSSTINYQELEEAVAAYNKTQTKQGKHVVASQPQFEVMAQLVDDPGDGSGFFSFLSTDDTDTVIAKTDLNQYQAIQKDFETLANSDGFEKDSKGYPYFPAAASVDKTKVPTKVPDLLVRPSGNPELDKKLQQSLRKLATDPAGKILIAAAAKNHTTIGFDEDTPPFFLGEYLPRANSITLSTRNLNYNTAKEEQVTLSTIAHELGHAAVHKEGHCDCIVEEALVDEIAENIAARVTGRPRPNTPDDVIETRMLLYAGYPATSNVVSRLKELGFQKQEWEAPKTQTAHKNVA